MSDEHDAEPGTADTGPGRRRARVDHVGDELAALRRDVREHGGLLAEALPRLDDLAGRVAGLTDLVADLVADHAEQQREDDADREARRQAGMLDEPPSPWAWPVMDRPTAQAAWAALGRWVAAVLCCEQQLPLRRLPSCWPLHSGAVAELSALRASHVASLRHVAHPTALLAWHRELPAALDRLVGMGTCPGAIDATTCPPGLHLVADSLQLPPQREVERVGALPSGPHAWGAALDHAVTADLAGRRPGRTPQAE